MPEGAEQNDLIVVLLLLFINDLQYAFQFRVFLRKHISKIQDVLRQRHQC